MRRHRRSIRFQGWDYTRAGAYFVTICTHGRETWLGEVDGQDVNLSQFGRIVEECWAGIPRSFAGVDTDAFVLMPNHIHGIIVIGDVHQTGTGVGAKHSKNASPLQPRAYALRVFVDVDRTPAGAGARVLQGHHPRHGAGPHLWLRCVPVSCTTLR